MTNVSFGGGGTFHGAPFHRLGVQHALPDCDLWHGAEGRRDVVGFFFDGEGSGLAVDALAPILISGEVPSFNHFTAGYPEFTAWPSAWSSSTHQTMYYRWLERAYLGGLRLLVQHATGNSVLCDLVTAIDSQVPLHSCNDMESVDRAIDGDAQHGALHRRSVGRPRQGLAPRRRQPRERARGDLRGQDGRRPRHRDLQPVRLFPHPARGIRGLHGGERREEDRPLQGSRRAGRLPRPQVRQRFQRRGRLRRHHRARQHHQQRPLLQLRRRLPRDLRRVRLGGCHLRRPQRAARRLRLPPSQRHEHVRRQSAWHLDPLPEADPGAPLEGNYRQKHGLTPPARGSSRDS